MRQLGSVTDKTKTHARNNEKLRKQEQQDLGEGHTWQRLARKLGALRRLVKECRAGSEASPVLASCWRDAPEFRNA
jgi:hypothetical protein